MTRPVREAFPLNRGRGGAERYGTVLEADSLLSGTFELFPLAEVLGLIERAAATTEPA